MSDNLCVCPLFTLILSVLHFRPCRQSGDGRETGIVWESVRGDQNDRNYGRDSVWSVRQRRVGVCGWCGWTRQRVEDIVKEVYNGKKHSGRDW